MGVEEKPARFFWVMFQELKCTVCCSQGPGERWPAGGQLSVPMAVQGVVSLPLLFLKCIRDGVLQSTAR